LDTHNGFEVVICGQCGMGVLRCLMRGLRRVDERMTRGTIADVV